MPRLKLGVQSLVNQWVNVNKEHAAFNREVGRSSPSGSNTTLGNSTPKSSSSKHNPRKRLDDDCITVVTASTADASASVSTMSTSHSSIRKADKYSTKAIPQNISLENLSFMRRRRKGCFGISYTGKYSLNEKVPKKANETLDGESANVEIQVVTTHSQVDRLISELNAIKSVSSHSNLVLMHGWTLLSAGRFDERKTYGLVYDLDFSFTQLTEWLQKIESSSSLAPHAFYWDILSGTIKGLKHLHSHGISHGCLNPDNIHVIAENEESNGGVKVGVKITDYGIRNALNLRQIEEATDQHVVSYKVCSRYSAPEHIRSDANLDSNQSESMFKADIYSFGMISWHIITREVPFSFQDRDEEIFEMMRHNEKGHKSRLYPLFPENMPRLLKLFLERCLSDDPKKRPCSKEIDEHILEELQKNLLKVEELDWIRDHQGHQAYGIKTSKVEPNPKEHVDDENIIEIPHRKMSELSVRDARSDEDESCNAHNQENEELNVFSKRNLDMDISSLTKSQRKGLLRLKRLKFTRNKNREKPPQKQKKNLKSLSKKLEDSSGSTRSNQLDDEECKKEMRNIPYAPQLIKPSGNRILKGPILERPRPLPLFQPILPGPINTKIEEKRYEQDLLTSKQILHFNHSKPANHIASHDYDPESNIGRVLPPKNHESIFRRQMGDGKETRISDDTARLDAVEVLTTHFYCKPE